MKLVGKHIERDRSGRVTLCPEESEDMWHVYNLILKGDRVKSTTERRIRNETSTGSSESHRMRLSLTIEITDIDFDPSVCLLRLNGKNLTESPHIKLGAYHTVDLELHQNFSLYKNEWDSIALDRVSEACDVTKRADAGAVILQEGLANVCLLTQHMTLVRQRLEVPIPRKRRGSVANYEKGIERFFVQIYEAITRHFDFDIIKVIIIAGPGFIKDQFYDFLFDYATKKENKLILKNKSKFLSIHASSGHKHSLQEVMENPSIQNRLADTKAAFEVNTLQKFYDMLNNDPDRAFYGWSHVNYAAEQGAIMTLLISDGLFRSDSIQIRRQYTKLVESVKDGGGNVAIFSSLHVSGEQLNQLTGIAAILKFPLPDIDDLELMNLEDEMKLKRKDQDEDEINY